MTHLLDTSALLAHYLGEGGAGRVQALFEDGRAELGVSILTLFEFELRLHRMGMDAATRAAEVRRYVALMDAVQEITEPVRAEALVLRTSASGHIAAMDVLIAASASVSHAILIHRDPHFAVIPGHLLRQEVLPDK